MAVTAKDVIDAFLARRNELLGTKYKVVTYPDEANRSTKEVDAIATSAGAPSLAIEVTQLETYCKQIQDEVIFTRNVVPIENALAGRYGDVHIGVTFVYLRDHKWGRDLARPLQTWLDANVDSLPEDDGKATPERDIPGVGLAWVRKRRSRRPGVYVSRTVPSNVVIPEELPAAMNRALDHKYNELAEYKNNRDHVSVMLLDSRDIALTNEAEQYKAFLRAIAANPRPGLDEVWIASVFDGLKESNIDCYCFRAEDGLMKDANPENFMFGREYEAYWNDVLAKEDAEGGDA